MQFIQSFFTLYFLDVFGVCLNIYYIQKNKVFIQNVKKEMIVNIKLIIQSKILHIFSFCGNNFSKAPTNNIRNMTTSNNVSDIYYTSVSLASALNLYCCIFSPFS